MATIQDYKDAWARANAAGDRAGMDAAHSGAEAIRAAQGYSGGADGSERISFGGGGYSDRGISSQDQSRIDSLKAQYDAAKASGASDGVLNDIHHSAEYIRSQYGYSGGVDGSGYVPLQNQQQGQGRAPTKSGITSASSQSDYINALYAAQQQAALQALKSAYEQNKISLDAQAQKIPQTYQVARNQTAANAEQGRAAFNERAAANGINSGAGSQVALSMSNQNAANMSTLNTQEANAVTDLDNTRLKLSTAYQNDIAQAIASGDMAKAQALYGEAVRVDNGLVAQSQSQADEDYRYWAAQNTFSQQQREAQEEHAKLLAAYGDFSGFEALGWTPEQISMATAVWAAKNPKLAPARGINVPTYAGGGGSYKGGSGGGGNTQQDGGSIFGTTASESKYRSYVDDLNQLAQQGGNVGAKIKTWLGAGKISETQAEQMAGMFGG